MLGSIGTSVLGLRIIESDAIGDPYEDWSMVRSPGRARRRLRQGHRQNIVTRYRANGQVFHDKGRNTLYVHPHDRPELERKLMEPQTNPGAPHD